MRHPRTFVKTFPAPGNQIQIVQDGSSSRIFLFARLISSVGLLCFANNRGNLELSAASCSCVSAIAAVCVLISSREAFHIVDCRTASASAASSFSHASVAWLYHSFFSSVIAATITCRSQRESSRFASRRLAVQFISRRSASSCFIFSNSVASSCSRPSTRPFSA